MSRLNKRESKCPPREASRALAAGVQPVVSTGEGPQAEQPPPAHCWLETASSLPIYPVWKCLAAQKYPPAPAEGTSAQNIHQNTDRRPKVRWNLAQYADRPEAIAGVKGCLLLTATRPVWSRDKMAAVGTDVLWNWGTLCHRSWCGKTGANFNLLLRSTEIPRDCLVLDLKNTLPPQN